MPEYILNRKHLHRSLMGFTIAFEPGKPVFVPNMIEKEVIALGAVRAEGDTPSPLDDVADPKVDPQGDERVTALNAAFDEIVARNNSKEFTGSGQPTIKAVEKIVGFDVDKVELAEAWTAYVQAKAEQQ